MPPLSASTTSDIIASSSATPRSILAPIRITDIQSVSGLAFSSAGLLSSRIRSYKSVMEIGSHQNLDLPPTKSRLLLLPVELRNQIYDLVLDMRANIIMCGFYPYTYGYNFLHSFPLLLLNKQIYVEAASLVLKFEEMAGTLCYGYQGDGGNKLIETPGFLSLCRTSIHFDLSSSLEASKGKAYLDWLQPRTLASIRSITIYDYNVITFNKTKRDLVDLESNMSPFIYFLMQELSGIKDIELVLQCGFSLYSITETANHLVRLLDDGFINTVRFKPDCDLSPPTSRGQALNMFLEDVGRALGIGLPKIDARTVVEVVRYDGPHNNVEYLTSSDLYRGTCRKHSDKKAEVLRVYRTRAGLAGAEPTIDSTGGIEGEEVLVGNDDVEAPGDVDVQSA